MRKRKEKIESDIRGRLIRDILSLSDDDLKLLLQRVAEMRAADEIPGQTRSSELPGP